MIFIGPISSVFDFLTFFVLLRVFHAERGALSHRVVRRVALHADARALRHPHLRAALAQPSERGARRVGHRASWSLGAILPATPVARRARVRAAAADAISPSSPSRRSLTSALVEVGEASAREGWGAAAAILTAPSGPRHVAMLQEAPMRHLAPCLLGLLVLACSTSSGSTPQPPGPSVPLQPGSPWPKFRGNAAQTALGTVHATQHGRRDVGVRHGRGHLQLAHRRAPTGRSTSAAPTRTSMRSAPTAPGSGSCSTGRDHRLVGPARRSGPRLLRLRRRQAARGRRGTRARSSGRSRPSCPRATGGFINWFEGNVAIGA